MYKEVAGSLPRTTQRKMGADVGWWDQRARDSLGISLNRTRDAWVQWALSVGVSDWLLWEPALQCDKV
jgi:hypothetical protein